MRVHGGRPPEGVVDFSTPLNPLGPPPQLEEALRDCVARRVHHRYPDYEYRELRSVLAEFYELEQQSIAVFNGAAEPLTLIPLAVRARSIIAVEPTFGDHHLLAQAIGASLVRVRVEPGSEPDTDSIVEAARRAEKPAVLLLSRPNNPIGYALSRSQLEDITARLPHDTVLVIDGAFMDLCSCPPLPEPGDWVEVRSLTKSFAAPGLRLGFVTGDERIVRLLDEVRQPWPIDSVTACTYATILRDKKGLRAYLSQARRLVEEERRWLSRELRAIGLQVYESRAPFLLVRHEMIPHPRMQELLVGRGVYVRDASSFYGLDETYSRISVRTRRYNRVLVNAFREVYRGCSVDS